MRRSSPLPTTRSRRSPPLCRGAAQGASCALPPASPRPARPRASASPPTLESAAGALPYFGPNCYGFINLFDGAALWPDQVVGARPTRGVALICQSGTIALNLLFNQRSLPIGYLITIGNQTRLAIEDLIDTARGRSPGQRVRPLHRRHQGCRGLRARGRQGARSGQADRADQGGPHRGGGAHGSQPYGRARRRGRGVRRLLPASRDCALRFARNPLRDAEGVAYRRTACPDDGCSSWAHPEATWP